MRPVSSRTRSSVSCGSARSTSKWVTASRGSSVSVETRVRTRRSRPSGASIVPRRAGGRPSTSARYSRTSSRAASCALSAACTGSERARTSRPDVSRSSRWTIPARSRVVAAGDAARQRLHERALRVPARRVDDDARRACRPPAGGRPPTRSRSARPASSRARRRPRPAPRRAPARRPRSTWRFGCTAPSTVTWPPSIRRCAAAREPACGARNTSSRSPAASGRAVSSRGIGRGAPARRSLEHVDQRDHAERDRRCRRR